MIRIFISAAIAIILAPNPLVAQTLTIDSCNALAVKNYPLVKQYELVEKTKEFTLDNAAKAYLPQVNLTAIEGYVLGGVPAVGNEGGSNFKFIGIGQVNQVLWDGGATKTQKKIINAQAETEKAGIDVALHDLASRVSQLYFGILLVDEQLKQLDIQDGILGNNINRIKQLNDNGLAYKTDVDEIRVEQIKLKQQKTEFRYARNGYLIMLSFLTGIKLNDQTILQKPAESNGIQGLQIIRPELLLYKNQRSLVRTQSEMLQVNLMPKIGLMGAGLLLAPGIKKGSSSASGLGVTGLSASWNIGALYRNSNNKELSKQALKKIDVQEEIFLFNTSLQLTQASANIEKQKAVLSEDKEIVSLRKTIREGYQLKYDTGAGTLIDLLNATEKESEARAQQALHEMQLLMTIHDYKTISGN